MSALLDVEIILALGFSGAAILCVVLRRRGVIDFSFMDRIRFRITFRD